MGHFSRTAAVVWWVLVLGGCSAIAGLNEIQEMNCAPNCAVDPTGGPDGNAVDLAEDGSRADSPTADGPSPRDGTSVDSTSGSTTEASADTSIGVDGPGDTSPAVDSSPGQDASVDASGADAARDTGNAVDAPSDRSNAPETGCGPTNTVQNCGACGETCASTSTATASASCSGTACTYTCGTDQINNGQDTVPAYLDCNATIGFDTDGCECTATLTKSPISCCGTSCPIQHNIGLPNTSPYPPEIFFYDCNPAGTWNATTAMEACTAFEGGPNFASDCSMQTCSGSGAHVVCGQNGLVCPCWQYDGANAGQVAVGVIGSSTPDSCFCPGASSANTTSWQ